MANFVSDAFDWVTDTISGGNQGKANDAALQALRAAQGLETPDIEKMMLKLQALVQQGTITPEQAQTFMQDPSAMNGITLDPKLKAAQMDALSSLQDIGESGGLNDTDRANLQEIQNEELARARGSREAIIQNANQRGLGGSGIELQSQMQNQQDSATRANNRGTDVAGMAQQRALDALASAGMLGTNIGNQEFGQKSSVAGANDAISRFNTQNMQDTSNLNVGNRNTAQAANLGERQRIADANTDMMNNQQQYNKQLNQQDFENRARKATGVASGYQNQGTQFNNNSLLNSKVVGSGMQAGATYAALKKKDGGLVPGEATEDDSVPTMLQPGEVVIKKEDVPEYMKKIHTNEKGEFDVAALLDQLTGGEYGYSGKGMKKGGMVKKSCY